jgi:integrase/recombinase XerD
MVKSCVGGKGNGFLLNGGVRSQRGAWTSQAIQLIVKKYLKQLGLYERGKSVHSLRHSYAVKLYAVERDLRAVQKQLRHVSIQSTMVYADVTDEAIGDQIKGLWN